MKHFKYNAYAVRLALILAMGLPVSALAEQASPDGKPAQGDSPVIRKSFAESKPGKAPTLPVAKGAPNIIWILLDEVGYGAASTFGGGARTLVLDSLANNWLRYTNFHNTAVCSPSRAAALIGRNHHSDQWRN